MTTALIIFAAKYLIALGALALLGFWVIAPARIKKLLALQALIALPVVYTLARLAGMLWGHEQPFAAGGYEPLVPHEVDNSFPSDHTAIAGVFAGLGFLYSRKLGVLLGVLTLLIGVARVAAGLHYTVDIVAALLLAVGAVYAAQKLSSLIQGRASYLSAVEDYKEE